MFPWRTIVCSGSALAVCLVASCGTAQSPSSVERRNVIFIVVDTLRADYLGTYGGDVSTPTLDALAASGAVFRRAYSHIPLTGPSHASMFTSSLPSDHGCTVNSQVFSDQNETIAEILGSRGWRTSAFVSLGVLRSRFGFSQGFDEYSDAFPGRWWKSADEMNADLFAWLDRRESGPTFLMLHYSDPHSPYAPPDETYPAIELRRDSETLETLFANSRPSIRSVELEPGVNEFELAIGADVDRSAVGCGIVRVTGREIGIQFTSGDDVRDIEENYCPLPGLPTSILLTNPSAEVKRVNFALTLHVNLSPEGIVDLYRKELAYLDKELAKAFDALKRAGVWENSVIVFTSDHGESLGQHDHIGHVEHLYDSQLRIPFFIVAPGLIPPGTVIDGPARHIDILPTILDILDVSTDLSLRGRSLLPVMTGEDDALHAPPVLAETHRPEAQFDQRAVVFDGYKYIVNATSDSRELYSLADDPGELDNLIERRADLIPLMQTILTEEFERSIGAWNGEETPIELTDEERAQLQALGYAGD